MVQPLIYSSLAPFTCSAAIKLVSLSLSLILPIANVVDFGPPKENDREMKEKVVMKLERFAV